MRTCSHIKTNGTKCGSPALRHQTLCYFHYQWDRRERRRVRLGGPVGMNKNTGIDLPILEGPESIMLAIMEVQRALLDARIDRQMAHTLLYSLQLAIQLKVHSYSGLSDKYNSVPTCPELDQELELDRARGLRPATDQCLSCRKKDSCTTPKDCRKPPLSVRTPLTGAVAPRRPRDPIGQPLVSPLKPSDPSEHAPNFCHAEEHSDEASLSSPRLSATPESVCHPERSAAVPHGVDGPALSPPTTTPNFCHAEEHSDEASLSLPPTSRIGTAVAVDPRNLKPETESLDPALKGGAMPGSSLRDESPHKLSLMFATEN